MALAGALEIQLRADVARFQQDMSQVKSIVGGTARDMEMSFGRVGDAVGRIGSAFAALGLTIGVGAILALGKAAVDAADHLNDLTKSTGLAVEELAGLGIAAKQSGGDLDGIASSITKLSQNMGKNADQFRALGITAKDPLEAFKQFADVFAKLEDAQLRAALGMAGLGKSWASAAPLLAEGGQRIGEMVEQGARLSGMTKELAEQSDALNDKLVILTGTGGAMNAVLNQVLPLLNLLADDMVEAKTKTDDLSGSFNPLLEAGKAIIVLFGNVSFVFKGIGNDLGAMGAQLAALAQGNFSEFMTIGRMVKEDAHANRVAFDRWEQGIMNVGTAAQVTAKKLDGMDQVSRRMASEARATARAEGETAARRAKAFLDFESNSKKAADEEKKRLAELERLRKLDAKGWVDKIEADIKEYEDGLKVQRELAENYWRDQEKMRQRDSAGWVAYIEAQIAEYEDGLRSMGNVDSNIQISDKAKKELDDFLDPAKAKSFGDALSDAFGKAGSALGKLIVSFEAYGRKQAEIDKAREANAKINDPAIRAQNEIKLAEMSAQAQISAYGDMAAAAKGFFEAGSTGYKALEAAEKVFRAFELASAIQNMLTKSGLLTTFTRLFVASKATETAATVASVAPALAADAAKGASAAAVGVATQAQGDPYTAWIRMAAMAATMAALGFAVAGSFSGGGGGATAAQRQREQGTGTVLGDPSAKSESLTKSIQEIEKIDRVGLTYTHDMLEALRSIDSAMSNLATLIFRTTGITTGTDIGVQGLGTTTTARPLVGGLDSLNQSIANALGFGNLVSGILGLWGKTTKEITDAGIRVFGTVGDLIKGIGIQSFANVRTTTSSWFGLSKDESNSTELGAIDPRLLNQFQLIFSGIASSVESAAKALGIWFPGMADAIQGFVVDLGDISLKDLKGQELQDALNNIFSSFGDNLAASVMPTEMLDRFQKVGEGAFETMMRLAAENELVKQTFDALGLSLNATGLSATMMRLELVQLMGGAEEFATQTQSYFENFFSATEQHAIAGSGLADEFERLGVTMPTTKDGFRDLVQSLDLSTESGREMFAALMSINEPFAQWADSIVGLDGQLHSTNEVLEQHTSLQERLDLATGAKTAKQIEREHEMAEAIDETSVMLLQAIYAQEDYNEGVAAAQDRRRTEMGLEAELLEAQGDSVGALALQRALETEGMNAAEIASYDYCESLEQQIATARLATEAAKTKTGLEKELFDLTHSESEILANNRALRLDELELQEQAAGLAPGTLTNIQNQINAQEDANAAIDAAAEAAERAADAFERMQNQLRQFQDTRIGGATLEDAQFNADIALNTLNTLVPGLSAFDATIGLSTEQFLTFNEEQRDAILNYRKANEAVLNFSNSLIPRDATGNPLPSGGYWDFSSGYGVWVVGTGGGGGTQDNSQDILRQRLEMLARIYELTGDKAGAAAVLEQQHAMALAALDPSLRELQVQLWGLEAAAVQAAKTLRFTNAERDLLIQIARARGDEEQAIELERDAILQSINEEWGEGSAAASRLIAMYEELWSIQGDLGSSTADWIKQLQDWLAALQLDTTLSPLTANQRFDFAQQQYVETLMKAQGGDADARAQFTQIADAYLRESLSMFGRASVDYESIWRAIQDQTQGLIDVGLGATAPATMSDLQTTMQSGWQEQGRYMESLLTKVDTLTNRIDQLTRVTEESGDKIAVAVESQTDDIVTAEESIARNYQTPTTEARLV